MKRRLFPCHLLLLFLVTALAFVPFDDAQAQTSCGRVIKIASQSPLSGPLSVLGIGLRNAAELAIEQRSAALEAMRYPIEFVPFDDQATPDVALANAQTLVADPCIMALVGHLLSSTTLAAMDVYEANHLAVVAPDATNPQLTERGYSNVFRLIGRDDAEPIAAAFYAASPLRVRTVTILHDSSTYGQGAAEAFAAQAESQRITILDSVETDEYADFADLLPPILASHPDAIYFGGYYDQASVFINQARAAGFRGYFMGGEGFDAPDDFLQIAGESGVGTLYTRLNIDLTLALKIADYYAPLHPDWTADPDVLRHFMSSYQEQYGEAPQAFSEQAYDAAGIVLEAIGYAVQKAGRYPTRLEVAEAVRSIGKISRTSRNGTGYPGLTGTIAFDEKGDRQTASYYIVRMPLPAAQETAVPPTRLEGQVIARVDIRDGIPQQVVPIEKSLA